MSILKVINLKKSYGKVQALKGINFEVESGEVYGFIGPNGAGKTTTIRTILGILKADEGKSEVFGLDAWNDAVDIHKRIAYVPGEVNLWPNLTGGEVIDFYMNLRGENNQERKSELIEMFDLDPTKKCRSYSKGNRQKVALISALASDAELFILDEPTSGLDPLMEKTFQQCIFDLKKAGKSVFLSSHILSEVEKLCDRLSIIREGEIIESGSLDDLRHLTRTNIKLKTKKAIEGLSELDGVYDLHEEDLFYQFQIDTDEFSKIIKYVSKFEVLKLESTPPTLEELFLIHYEGKSK
ncbi:MAG: ABC transporter ATP-binding protein [Candidatus Izimaplasma sp.]|nr:ABC transporter ATP-binding protein [Candidatus Izimaplasma bacterium]